MCCGTKRLVEIPCPSGCAYLASAREHPAAAVRRQQARDLAILLPALQHLTERQHHLFFLFQSVIARHQPGGLSRLVDADVAEAAGALASTLDTAARGVIYEQAPQSRVAQALVAEMQALLAQAREQGVTIAESDAATVLRTIEQGAKDAGPWREGDAAYLELMARLLSVARAADAPRREAAPAGPLIIT